jgi:hypothetical protein
MFYVSVVIGVKPVSYVGITIIMIIVIAINILILYLLALKKFFLNGALKKLDGLFTKTMIMTRI